MNIQSMVERAVGRATSRAGNLIRRGTLGSAVSDTFTSKIHGNKYEDKDESFEGVEHWQGFGHASRAPQGGEALLCEPEGSGEGAIAVATNDRDHRPGISEGDSCLYSSKSGSDQAFVHVKASDEVEIEADDIFIGDDGNTVIGAATTAEYTFKGLLFNTAISLMLTPLAIALTSTANAFGTTTAPDTGSGLALVMNMLATDLVGTARPATVAAMTSAEAYCKVAYLALNTSAAAVTTFNGALTGLLTTQVKVN